MQFVLVLVLAVASWHVTMAVECAGRCVRRPKVVHADKPSPQCKGPQCQTPPPVKSSR
jgi:hypothetical protein